MKPTNLKADKYILRFDCPGHRDRLKEAAAKEKRTLNKHLLALIEAGERAIQRSDQHHQHAQAA